MELLVHRCVMPASMGRSIPVVNDPRPDTMWRWTKPDPDIFSLMRAALSLSFEGMISFFH